MPLFKSSLKLGPSRLLNLFFALALSIALPIVLVACGGSSSSSSGDGVANIAPVANSGLDITVDANSAVTLNGSGSSDSDGTIASYSWAQATGTTVTLSGSSGAQPDFTAPLVNSTLVFQLTVTDDDGATDTDSVTITVENGNVNSPPIANAGSDVTVDANTLVNLDGGGSADSDGDIASYTWVQTQGESVSLNNANTVQPSFVAPANNGTLVFQLTVTDDNGSSSTSADSVTVTVENGVTLVVGLDARPNNMSCIAPDTPGSSPDSLELVDVFPALNMTDFPMGMFQMPGNDDYFYVITRGGQVLRFDNDPSASSMTTVLDISAQIDFLNLVASEGGLLGFAFHPDVANNNAVYLYYTASGGSGDGLSIISRFTMANDATIDPNSEEIVLQVEQPFGNHNGGGIGFGPDGNLYIGFGDGGNSNDSPHGHGQNTNTLLGAMLRIDVDPTTTTPPFYSIPPDNPFVSGGGAEEIYAYGLRNPFRWSFDTVTDVLWLADVGQSAREEVDHIVNGGNYGWNDMEGNICGGLNSGADCSSFVPPIHDYPRNIGNSITGGYVYRGTEISGLEGAYVFGDYGSNRVFTLTANGSDYVRTEVAVPPNSSGGPVSFAQDNAGEIYVLLAFPGNGRSILKLQAPSGPPPGSNIPNLLSNTGCFDSGNPSQPDDGLIPYDVASPLWSDGAQKNRWLALPNGETIDVDASGDFEFPVGSVLVKDFRDPNNANVMIETRLLMLHQTGWAGYSYKWRDDQTDADLLFDADDDVAAGLNWHFPSAAECRQCHTATKKFALAPEVLQLNHEFVYPQTGRTANQVHTLNQLGVFTVPPAPALTNATMFAFDDVSATLEQRAKSYLHSNCSQCHQPGGTGEGGIDLRFETPLAQMNVCNTVPANNLGNANARFIVPGSPSDSVILTRMQSSVASGVRMPPLATEIVDTAAVGIFTDWINDLAACP